MGQFIKGDVVKRLCTGNYQLTKTENVLRHHFPGQSHANTTDSVGDSTIEWVDEEGALVSYDQGGGYNKRGWLYYANKDLKLVKRLKEVINDYAIY